MIEELPERLDLVVLVLGDDDTRLVDHRVAERGRVEDGDAVVPYVDPPREGELGEHRAREAVVDSLGLLTLPGLVIE